MKIIARILLVKLLTEKKQAFFAKENNLCLENEIFCVANLTAEVIIIRKLNVIEMVL